jgi:hypothetical protein
MRRPKRNAGVNANVPRTVPKAVVAPAARSRGRFARREPRPGVAAKRGGVRAGSRGTLTRGLGGLHEETPGRGEYFLPHVRHDRLMFPSRARRSRRRWRCPRARRLHARRATSRVARSRTLGIRFVFAFRVRAALMTRGSRRPQARLTWLLESGSAVQARMASTCGYRDFSLRNETGALLARPFASGFRDAQSKRPAAWASMV